MWGFPDNNKTENERWLEDQLEQERQWRREQEEQARREREARREEARMRAQESYRQADTWPETLRKQAALMGRESAELRSFIVEDPELVASLSDDMFGPGAAACERALEIWKEEAAGVEQTIKDLEAEIQRLRDHVRFAVADRLDAENPDGARGWQLVTRELRETPEEPGALSRWLTW